MCALAHYFERAGVATVVIGLVPQHVRAMQPPRALNVPFGLGRPLGAPNAPDLQRTVLRAALALLDRADGPAIVELDGVTEPQSTTDGTPWACPVSFPVAAGTDLASRVIGEVRLLMPWFERGKSSRGHSGAQMSGLEMERLVEWLAAFLTDEPPSVSPVAGRTLADTFKLAVEDLKAFYLEAATAEPGAPAAETLREWFWDDTAAAALVIALREALAQHADDGIKAHARFTLVPATEVARKHLA